MLEGGADIRFIQEMLGHARGTQVCTRASLANLTPRSRSQLIDRIIDRAEDLALFPRLGHIVEEEEDDPTLLQLTVDSYRVIYRLVGDDELPYVVTVIHARRDLHRKPWLR